MKKILPLFLAALLLCSLGVQAATLGIGDPAPELKVAQWIKGAPVASLDPAQTYVVEFWATWCGPCRATIPHLTELAREFPSVTFIGMNVWEKGKPEAVSKFVADMGEKMDYAVATDTADQFMAKNWMEAAGQGGIPTAFLVYQGQVAWIGHPMDGLDGMLKEIAAGSFDVEKSKQRAEVDQRLQALFLKAMKGASDEELAEECQALEALHEKLGGLGPDGMEFNVREVIQQARYQAALQAYQKTLSAESEEAELAPLEAAARAAAPAGEDFDKVKARMQQAAVQIREEQRVQAVVEQYFHVVGGSGDPAQAAEFAQQLEALDIQDPRILNAIAWNILTAGEVQQRDLPLATRLAKKAMDATEEKRGDILDTYARALFDAGNIAEAIEFQKKAVAADPEDAEIASTLQRYLAAVPAAAE